MRWFHYLLAVLFPIYAIPAAIVAFARNQIGPGIALLMTGFCAWVAWLALMVA